ncbi:MAG: 50S ribosomal protein L4 [Ilumatobacteraceae bacterium]
MAEITMKTATGQDAGRTELDDAVFGLRPNVAVMHQVVTAQLAHRRAGTHNTKTRAEVRGGGAKPYRQKGTGNARQGSTNSPQFSGGGVAHGPKPRSYAQRTPKKMIKLALRSALSDRAAEGKVVVVDDWGISAPRTKDAAAALTALGLDGRVLVVVESFDTAVARSFRNLPLAQLIRASELNAYDVLCNEWIVFSEFNLPTAGTTTSETFEDVEVEAPIAVHATDPAEGPREADDDEVAAPAPAGSAEGNPSQEVDGSAPDRSDDDTSGELQRASGAAAANVDDSQPEGYPIKGNADSMLYHVPGSSHYDRTIAEVWFDTEESAEAAGFQKPPSQRESEES